MPFTFFKHRSQAAVIAASAVELMSAFGDQAYYEARDREKGLAIDRKHSTSHWRRVALEIARREGRVIGERPQRG